MTNLQRWLMYLGLFAVPYITLLWKVTHSPSLNKFLLEVQLIPVVIIGIFGIHVLSTLISNTVSMKDCPEAYKELQEEIVEARKDLRAKGILLPNDDAVLN